MPNAASTLPVTPRLSLNSASLYQCLSCSVALPVAAPVCISHPSFSSSDFKFSGWTVPKALSASWGISQGSSGGWGHLGSWVTSTCCTLSTGSQVSWGHCHPPHGGPRCTSFLQTQTPQEHLASGDGLPGLLQNKCGQRTGASAGGISPEAPVCNARYRSNQIFLLSWAINRVETPAEPGELYQLS